MTRLLLFLLLLFFEVFYGLFCSFLVLNLPDKVMVFWAGWELKRANRDPICIRDREVTGRDDIHAD